MRSQKQNGREGDRDKTKDQRQLAGTEPVTEIANKSYSMRYSCIHGMFTGDTHEMQLTRQHRNSLTRSTSTVGLRLQSACPSAISQQRWLITGYFCHGPVFEKEVRKNRDNLGLILSAGLICASISLFSWRDIYHAVDESILQYEGHELAYSILKVGLFLIQRTVNNAKHIAVMMKASEDLMFRRDIFTSISIYEFTIVGWLGREKAGEGRSKEREKQRS